MEGGHAVVDRVVRECTIAYGRYGRNGAAVGHAYAGADAPGGRRADAERLVAVMKALTGREPKVVERSDGKIEVACRKELLERFRHYAELAEAIEKWLKNSPLFSFRDAFSSTGTRTAGGSAGAPVQPVASARSWMRLQGTPTGRSPQGKFFPCWVFPAPSSKG